MGLETQTFGRRFRATGPRPGARRWAARRATAAVVLAAATLVAAQAAACPPSAILNGPPGEVREVTALLREHRVGVGGAGCAASVVQVTMVPITPGPGLRLRAHDAYGRLSEREVPDGRTAASLIESWVIEEDSDLLDPPTASVARPPPEGLVSAPAPAPQSTWVGWRLAGVVELSTSSDGSVWYGGALTGCRLWGPACVGGRARLSRDSGFGAPVDSGDIARTAAEALIIGALPLSWGAVAVTPLVGFGGGWTHTVEPASRGDHVGPRIDLGLRVEASVTAAVPIGRRWSIVGETGAGWGYPSSSAGGPDLPGPPALQLRAGLGCQYKP